jgi:ferrous iron transport protein B
VVLHPVVGPLLMAAVLFLVFQAVFAWAEAPMGWIEAGTGWLGEQQAAALLPDNWLRSLLVDGVIAGAGGVLVFLPQIVILFFFILVLEESGYLPRAAFLLDRLMGTVGLSGRSFIPLLSSHACAIPGIMATRSIADPRDRLVTIMLAPLMTCSARLPVYALLIGAFIPARELGGAIELQGLVLFGAVRAGIIGAMAVAWTLKRFTHAGRQIRPLMMELPQYAWPAVRNIALGLWQRVLIFLRRVGGIILLLTILLWFLASYPAPPAGATGPAIEYSLAGTLGARSPWCSSRSASTGRSASRWSRHGRTRSGGQRAGHRLCTVGDRRRRAVALAPLIAQTWSFATALSLLAWFVFAPQCLATLATVKRETNGWTWPLVMAGYLFGLAYLASFATYRITLMLTG